MRPVVKGPVSYYALGYFCVVSESDFSRFSLRLATQGLSYR